MYVGIDISKSTLDVKSTTWSEPEKYSNSRTGIEKLLKRLSGEAPSLVVMEATGGYERNVAKALQSKEISLAVMNPWQTKNFAKSLGKRAKTDKIDAEILSKFAEAVKPASTVVSSDEEFELKQLVSRRQQLVRQNVQEKNRLGHATPLIAQSIRKMIKLLRAEIKQITRKIKDRVGGLESTRARAEVLLSAKGVGELTAYSLCILLPELGKSNRKKIAALAGIAPFNDDSGKASRPRRIQGGRADVRSVLYMATLTAIRCNTKIKSYYKKLVKRGKKQGNKKIALVACMRKFLVCLNAMLKTNQPWKNTAK